MKLLRTLTLLWANDADAVEKVLDTTLDQVLEDPTKVAEGGSNTMLVAADNVYVDVPFGPVTTANRILLVTDKTITVKLNSGSEVFSVVPKAQTTTSTRSDRGVLYLEGPLTRIQVANPGANVATVLYGIAGV